MRGLFILLFCFAITSHAQQYSDTLNAYGDVSICFGSCNDQNKDQPLWNSITEEQADLFIWLGDNIYADTDDMKKLKREYARQLSNKDYQDLLIHTPINGVWDDHDYGLNDGGKEFKMRRASQSEFFDFIGVPKDHKRRQHDGTYGSQFIKADDLLAKIYYLDTRFFRDSLLGQRKQYKPNYTGTILGEEQWAWLEEEVSTSTADINIIVSSIQVIPSEHGWEKWANFPNDRIKLFNLLSSRNVKNPIILSGDRHVGELSSINWLGRTIIEVTASALTNSIKPRPEINKYRFQEYGDNGLIFPIHYGHLEISPTKRIMRVQLKGEQHEILSDYSFNLD